MATDDQALRGAALRALRALRDVPQGRLAAAAGLSRTTLHRIEHGATDVPRRYWRLFLEELDVTPEDLEALVEMARHRGAADGASEEELEDEREAAALSAAISTAVARAYRHQLRIVRTASRAAGEAGSAGAREREAAQA